MSEQKENEFVICTNCGTTYKEFRKNNLFGCSECYNAFSGKLVRVLKKIHGSAEYFGKTPLGVDKIVYSEKRQLSILRKQLNEAIKKERFEDAAFLRDKINDLEKALNES